MALATTMAAAEKGVAADDPAWSELRGISYVKKAAAAGKCSADWAMLKNQGGVGGVGTYWVTLVAGGLVDPDSAALTVRGQKLADAFLKGRHVPKRADLRRVFASSATEFDRQALITWGRRGSLDARAANTSERKLLQDALLQPEPHRRLATALAETELATNRRGFKVLAKALNRQADRTSKQLASTLMLVIAFEAIHRNLLDRFDRLRALDTRGRRIPMADAEAVIGAPVGLSGLADALRDELIAHADTLPDAVAKALHRFLLDTSPSLRATTSTELALELIRHHKNVQSGKTDASRQPKRPWIERHDQELVIAPRFALDKASPRAAGTFTHTYRLEQFRGLLQEAEGSA